MRVLASRFVRSAPYPWFLRNAHCFGVAGSASVLVGATSAGPVGGEVLGALAVAVHGQVPIARLASMIYAYPTFHRAIQAAVKEL